MFIALFAGAVAAAAQSTFPTTVAQWEASGAAGRLGNNTFVITGRTIPAEWNQVLTIGPKNEHSAGRLPSSFQVSQYGATDSLTIYFQQPVRDLHLIVNNWRGTYRAGPAFPQQDPATRYTFNHAFELASGLGAALIDGDTLICPDKNFHSGVLRFPDLVQTLTITSRDGLGASGQSLTFATRDISPLLFIPGIAGSALKGFHPRHGLTDLWPTLRGDNIAALDLRLDRAVNAFPTDVIRQVNTGIPFVTPEFYGPLLEHLTSPQVGHREFLLRGNPQRMASAFHEGVANAERPPTLFPFPYDWRRENADHLPMLRAYIQNIRQLHGGAKVNVIAHSMGGLLVRRYILEYGGGDFQYVATIGSPFLGTPVCTYRLLVGDFYGNEVLQGALDYVYNPLVREVLAGFPSSFELLPSFQYGLHSSTPVLSENGVDLDGNGSAFESYDVFRTLQFLDSELSPAEPLLTNVKLHGHANWRQDDWSSDSGDVHYLHIIGRERENKTTVQVVAERETSFFGLRNTRRYVQKKGAGDGTVALLSAERTPALRSPNTITKVLSGGAEVQHTPLTANPVVWGWLEEFLESGTLSGGATAPAVFAADAVVAQESLELSILGSSYVRVTDAAGQTNERFTELAIKAIPGVTARYDEKEDRVDLSMETGRALQIDSDKPEETLELLVVRRDPDGIATGVKRFRAQLDGQNWRLSLDSAGQPELRVDANADGVFSDSEVAPAVYTSGVGVIDLGKPALGFTKSLIGNGVAIALSAQDELTPSPAIHFAIDGGPLQLYSAPLQFPRNGNARLRAFAEDAAGNLSPIIDIVPAPELKGSYRGLLRSSTGEFAGSSTVNVTFTANGRVTGTGSLGGHAFRFLGKVDATGTLAGVRIDKAGHMLTVAMQDHEGISTLTGTIIDPLGASVGRFEFAPLAVYTRKQPCPLRGVYTVALPPTLEHPEAGPFPQGTGYLRIAVTPTGHWRGVGALGDGVAVFSGGRLTKAGQIPFAAWVYRKQGGVIGTLSFTKSLNEETVSGMLNWTRPALSNSSWFPAGFDQQIAVEGGRFLLPPAGVPPLDIAQGIYSMSGGGVPPFNGLTFHTAAGSQKIQFEDEWGIRASFDRQSTGLISGQFPAEIGGSIRMVPFRGVILQQSQRGVALFKGNQQTGTITFQSSSAEAPRAR